METTEVGLGATGTGSSNNEVRLSPIKPNVESVIGVVQPAVVPQASKIFILLK